MAKGFPWLSSAEGHMFVVKRRVSGVVSWSLSVHQRCFHQQVHVLHGGIDVRAVLKAVGGGGLFIKISRDGM